MSSFSRKFQTPPWGWGFQDGKGQSHQADVTWMWNSALEAGWLNAAGTPLPCNESLRCCCHDLVQNSCVPTEIRTISSVCSCCHHWNIITHHWHLPCSKEWIGCLMICLLHFSLIKKKTPKPKRFFKGRDVTQLYLQPHPFCTFSTPSELHQKLKLLLLKSHC